MVRVVSLYIRRARYTGNVSTSRTADAFPTRSRRLYRKAAGNAFFRRCAEAAATTAGTTDAALAAGTTAGTAAGTTAAKAAAAVAAATASVTMLLEAHKAVPRLCQP